MKSIKGLSKFDVAYGHCMMNLGKWYETGDFDRMSSELRDTMLKYENRLEELWGKDYIVFHAVLVSYYRFMKEVLR